jgi:hypothetical protein
MIEGVFAIKILLNGRSAPTNRNRLINDKTWSRRIYFIRECDGTVFAKRPRYRMIGLNRSPNGVQEAKVNPRGVLGMRRLTGRDQPTTSLFFPIALTLVELKWGLTRSVS